MKILLTDIAIKRGYYLLVDPLTKSWERYSVVCEQSKIILVTSPTKYNCENYISFLTNKSVETPEFFKVKVNKYWRG